MLSSSVRKRKKRIREREKKNDRTFVRGRQHEINARPRHILHRSKPIYCVNQKRKANEIEEIKDFNSGYRE
jgi:hypothetical protein